MIKKKHIKIELIAAYTSIKFFDDAGKLRRWRSSGRGGRGCESKAVRAWSFGFSATTAGSTPVATADEDTTKWRQIHRQQIGLWGGVGVFSAEAEDGHRQRLRHKLQIWSSSGVISFRCRPCPHNELHRTLRIARGEEEEDDDHHVVPTSWRGRGQRCGCGEGHWLIATLTHVKIIKKFVDPSIRW